MKESIAVCGMIMNFRFVEGVAVFNELVIVVFSLLIFFDLFFHWINSDLISSNEPGNNLWYKSTAGIKSSNSLPWIYFGIIQEIVVFYMHIKSSF